MPELWDTNLNGQPDPTPNDRDRGQLRPPAYLLIALGIALVAILLVIAGLLFGPS
jgi:hypothetical protein